MVPLEGRTNDVFSFLGGADAEFQMIRPTNLVIWETILWAPDAGKKRFIPGGGYTVSDGIFRFKSTFSKHRTRIVRTIAGRMIVER